MSRKLGFRLEENEHPLHQGLGAFLGAMCAASLLSVAYILGGFLALLLTAVVIFSFSCYLTAQREHNKSIPAIVWNLGLALFASVVAHFIMKLMASD